MEREETNELAKTKLESTGQSVIHTAGVDFWATRSTKESCARTETNIEGWYEEVKDVPEWKGIEVLLQ